MEYEKKSNLEPVTIVLVRNVKPDRRNDFEEWARGMS
jgi:antibiotic biosynthesis monooxygenase (ABM) superfamily enzyme